MFNEMKDQNLSKRISNKSPAGGPEADKIFIEFLCPGPGLQVPEDLHLKTLKCQEMGNQEMKTAYLTIVIISTSCQNWCNQCF